MGALLPLAALIHKAVAQPNPRAQIEQVRRRDVGLRQPPRHQQLPQMPRVGPIGLRALLVALQRARLGRLGQMRASPDRGQLLDNEPPARRCFQRRLKLLAVEASQEPPHAGAIGRHHARARHLARFGIQPLRGDLRGAGPVPSRSTRPPPRARTRTPAPSTRSYTPVRTAPGSCHLCARSGASPIVLGSCRRVARGAAPRRGRADRSSGAEPNGVSRDQRDSYPVAVSGKRFAGDEPIEDEIDDDRHADLARLQL